MTLLSQEVIVGFDTTILWHGFSQLEGISVQFHVHITNPHDAYSFLFVRTSLLCGSCVNPDVDVP